jgi:hypothetical protein
LLQFVALGLALFAVDRVLTRDAAPREGYARIELTPDDVRQIGFAWIAQGRAAPSPEELRPLAEGRVREEILYREALALGLDRDDTIVRRRLAQKMEFLFDDVGALREPVSGELRAWFDAHAERFAEPPRVTFRHLWFSPDRRGAAARDDARRTLATLAGAPADAAPPADGFMFQDHYGDRSFDEIARTFGPQFAHALFAVPPGAWAGPLESGYGWHVVWVVALTSARVPAFEDVEPEVREAWIEAQRADVRECAFAALRARYEVVLPAELDVTDVASADTTLRARPR